MISYGPIEWVSRSGAVDKNYKYLQSRLSNIRLKKLFRDSGRKLSHYINDPQDIFAGACTVLRESVLRDPNQNITLNFNHMDRLGEDIRFSLELQRILLSSQILMDRRLLVRTSARGLETSSGEISKVKGLARLLRGIFIGDHIPETTKQFKQSEENDAFNVSLFSVVRSFILETDQKTYQLKAGERVTNVRRMKKTKALEKRISGEDIRPAIHAATNEEIPDYYVTIESN